MIRDPIKLTKSIINHIPYFTFNTPKQVYRPLVPLTQRYNLIFNHTRFAKNDLLKSPSIFWFWLPAAGMTINNYLTEWNMYTSTAFVALLVGGAIFKVATRDFNSFLVYSLQVDPDLRYIYLTVNQSSLTLALNNRFEVTEPEKKTLVNSYHPLKQKNPDAKIVYNYLNLKGHPQLTSAFQQTNKIESQIYRLKIPRQQIKFQIVLRQSQKPQYERDLERLTPKQMLKKYENNRILIRLKGANDKLIVEFPFEIESHQNNNKRYHDYLLSMVFGYQIDLSGNKIRKDTEKQEVSWSKEQKTK